MPDGRTYPLDHFLGLNEIGDAGLRDQVNQHYKSTFGASAAVGLLSGFAQFLTGAGFNRGTGDQPVIIAGGVCQCHDTSDGPDDEPISQSAADGHDSRRPPREGVSDERPGAAGVRTRA